MTTAPPIPVEDLFCPPERSRAQISPDGAWIAYLAPWKGRLNVWVRERTSNWSRTDADADSGARRLTADARRSIESFWWGLDGRAILFTQDSDGDENRHLLRVDVASGETVDLTPFDGVRVFASAPSIDGSPTAVVDLNLRAPDVIDTFSIDLDTGELTVLVDADARSGLWSFVAPDGRVWEIGLDASNDWVLHPLGEPERPVATFDGPDHPLGPLPMRATPDGTGLWVGTNHGTDNTRLVRIDLDTGAQHEVDSHPTFDLDTPRPEADPRFPSSLILHAGTGELLAARYLGERIVVHALDDEFAAVLAQLERLSDGDLGHVSSDRRGRHWVVDFIHDREPDVTWLYDHATGEAHELFRPFPHLHREQLAQVQPLQVVARDGLPLGCHLTLPLGEEPRRLPAVVVLHGGPWYRDSTAYDPEVQLLASRGYAVLQVDFRGSTGHGKAHLNAGIRQFARGMHDDVIDALDHVIEANIVDAGRVAIFGCSYGGYAALVGATVTPERFAAIVSYTGMSDLVRLHEEALPAAQAALANTYGLHIGDPTDPEQRSEMLERSPASHLDKIVAPTLLIHGERDVRVTRHHSDIVYAALQERGVEVEYLLRPDEGHWFVNPESKIELYTRLERFLALHLDGRRAS